MAGIGQARNTTLPRLIYSLGIPNIGVANAKMICKAFDYDLKKIRTADAETMAGIDGIGEVIGAAVADYFRDAKRAEQLDDLLGRSIWKNMCQMKQNRSLQARIL